MSQGERRLAAIMFTDMVGFTALSQKDEALSMRLLDECRGLLRPFFPKHGGREVKTIGDAFLVEFASALEAVRCAFDIQQSLFEFNAGRSPDSKILLRIGVHLGDVIERETDVYGDAVNVASRIEPLAKPGGVCISQQVYESVRNKFEFPMVEVGEKALKNVELPMKVYEAKLPWDSQAQMDAEPLDRRRVAVMPLVNMVTDPGEQYFADGMTEELISAISKVRELSVISRTSSMHYRNMSKRVTEIGKELSVGTVLEGSVRKAGNRVRITVQLIDASGDRHLWAENYDRTLEDVFAIQSDIASKVAEELRVKLVDSDRRMLDRKDTDNTEAYTNFLQGRELHRRGDEKSLREALQFMEAAIRIDGTFARAHCELAECYLRLGNSGYMPYQEAIAMAKVPLKRALHLDPDLADAHAALSVMLYNEDDVVGAEAEARRAIELNPSLPEAYASLANTAEVKRDVNEGFRLMEKYYALDPLKPEYINSRGCYLAFLGKDAEALEHWKKTFDLAPLVTYMNMAEYYLWKGDLGKSKQNYSEALKLDPNNPWMVWMRGFTAAMEGDRGQALSVIKQIEMSTGGALIENWIAYVNYALGDYGAYFSHLDRALELHALDVGRVVYSPLLKQSRDDPRYKAFLDKMDRMFWPAGRNAV